MRYYLQMRIILFKFELFFCFVFFTRNTQIWLYYFGGYESLFISNSHSHTVLIRTCGLGPLPCEWSPITFAHSLVPAFASVDHPLNYHKLMLHLLLHINPNSHVYLFQDEKNQVLVTNVWLEHVSI